MYNSVDSVHSSSPGLGMGSLHSGAPVGSYLVDATWNPDAIDTRANPNKGRRKLFKPTTTTTTTRPPPITTTRRPLTTTSTHVKFTPIPGNVKSKVSGSNDFLAYQEQKRKFLVKSRLEEEGKNPPPGITALFFQHFSQNSRPGKLKTFAKLMDFLLNSSKIVS